MKVATVLAAVQDSRMQGAVKMVLARLWHMHSGETTCGELRYYPLFVFMQPKFTLSVKRIA